MVTGAVRLSPSGPILSNANNAPYVPGPGARLRLVEAQGTLGTGTLGLIPTAPAIVSLASGIGVAPATTVALLVPNPGLNYRATVKCDVQNPSTNVLGEVQLYIETSEDGVTFTERASNTHIINSTEVAPAVPLARQISLELALTLGANIGVTGAPQSPTLVVRAKIGATSGGGILQLLSPVTPGGDLKSVGTFLLQLEECL